MKKLVSVVLATGLTVASSACDLGPDLTLEVFLLQVSPTQAQAGDEVKLTFNLTAISSGSVTLTAFIDDEEHASEMIPGAFSGPFEWLLGDAAELIDRYGLGSHTAKVRAVDIGSGKMVTTGGVPFELVVATEP